MKDYIIIVNNVISEFDTVQDMNKGLELLAGVPLPVYQFKNMHPKSNAREIANEVHGTEKPTPPPSQRIKEGHDPVNICCDACKDGEKCESEA